MKTVVKNKMQQFFISKNIFLTKINLINKI